MKIVKLYSYPLKSSRGLLLDSVDFQTTGFSHDRSVAVIDDQQRVITGREYPQLLTILSQIHMRELQLTVNTSERYSFPLPTNTSTSLPLKLFRNKVFGTPFCKEANTVISQLLEGKYTLVFIGGNYRPLLHKRGGQSGDRTAFADSSPIHLINLKTLEYLNGRLSTKVDDRNFRPNIVIDGEEPFEEDRWSIIRINGYNFRLQEHTKRCIFTTISPDTQQQDQGLEPLSTIAQIRSASGLRPTFGINLVPFTPGHIEVGDRVDVLDCN